MGIWPGAEHYLRRYDYCAEYVTIMRDLWESGRSDFKGDFFQMDDCRCQPMPTAKIPIICAAQSDAGTRYATKYADYNFCASFGENQPTAVTASVSRLVAANKETGRDCGVMMTCDDFVIGMEQFGTRIMPRMQSREAVKLGAD